MKQFMGRQQLEQCFTGMPKYKYDCTAIISAGMVLPAGIPFRGPDDKDPYGFEPVAHFQSNPKSTDHE